MCVHIICSYHVCISYVHINEQMRISCGISFMHIIYVVSMCISYCNIHIICAIITHLLPYSYLYYYYLHNSGFVITGIVNTMDVSAVVVDGIKEAASLSQKVALPIGVITAVLLLKLKMLLNVVMPMKIMGLDSRVLGILDVILNILLNSMLQFPRMILFVGRFNALDIRKGHQFLCLLKIQRRLMPLLGLPRPLLLLLLQQILLPPHHPLLSLRSPQ